MRRFGIPILMMVAMAGCGQSGARDNVVHVDGSDAKMNAAIAKAQGSVDTIISALGAPQAGQSGFAVKHPFVDGGQTEHMWIGDLKFKDGVFHGTVNNEPELVKNVKEGQHVEIDKAKISDWMYVDNGKLVGGYTIRVLRDSMSASERAELDRSLPFRIE